MNKILEMKFGSHLYGTDTPNSDLDLKAIYLPTAREIVLGTYPKTINTSRPKQMMERNTKDDVDMECFSLDRFVDLLTQGQTVALDMLFAPTTMYTHFSPEGLIFFEVYKNRIELLNKNVNSFVGYAKQQAAKYGLKGFRVGALRATTEFYAKYPLNTKLREIQVDLDAFVSANETSTSSIKYSYALDNQGKQEQFFECCDKKVSMNTTIKYGKTLFDRMFEAYGHRALLAEQNAGIDWKALSHAVRVNLEAKELLLTNQITFPCPDRELLLKIKLGQLPYKEVAEMIEQGLEDLKSAQERSILRDKPNYQWAEDFIYEVYSTIVKKG